MGQGLGHRPAAAPNPHSTTGKTGATVLTLAGPTGTPLGWSQGGPCPLALPNLPVSLPTHHRTCPPPPVSHSSILSSHSFICLPLAAITSRGFPPHSQPACPWKSPIPSWLLSWPFARLSHPPQEEAQVDWSAGSVLSLHLSASLLFTRIPFRWCFCVAPCGRVPLKAL